MLNIKVHRNFAPKNKIDINHVSYYYLKYSAFICRRVEIEKFRQVKCFCCINCFTAGSQQISVSTLQNCLDGYVDGELNTLGYARIYGEHRCLK